MTNQKGIAPIAIILIIIGVLALGGGVWYIASKMPKFGPGGMPKDSYNQQPALTQQQNQATTTIDETADWKIYRNDKYGFEVRYPGNYYLYPSANNSTDATINITSYLFPNSNFESGNPQGLKIQILASSIYKSDNEFQTSLEIADELTGLKKQYTKINIGDKMFLKNVKWYIGGDSFLEGVFQPSHAIRNLNTGQTILFNIWDPSGNFNKEYNQILSTFKFIK